MQLTLSNCVGCGLPTLSLTVGAVSEAGFQWMFVILHDNMRNIRDTKQAVNGSLSIFLCVPFLEFLIWAGFLASFPLHVRLAHFLKTKWQHPGEGTV